MRRSGLALLVLLILLVIATTATVAYRAGTRARCRTGDVTATLTPEIAQQLASGLGSWVRNVRECPVGEYLVDTPAVGGQGQIMLGRSGRPVLLLSPEQTTLFDETGKRIVFMASHGRSPEGNRTSYEVYDAARGAYVENMDLESDGTIDLRSTEIPGREKTFEFRVGDRWLELVKRDGRAGTILDAEFMSADDARKRLGAKGTRKPN